MTDPRNPQDPYASFLVAASAGSGKTYQLSRRFLHLIGAGANPSSVLTVTFTKKAAGEMRQRILEEAARLTVCPKTQARFHADQMAFHAHARSLGAAVPPPRPAAEVGHLVMAASQTLKISTIDSLFLEWVRKFPHESSPEPGEDEARIPSPLKLLDPARGRDLEDEAWTATCRLLTRALDQNEGKARETLEALPDQDLRAAAGRIRALSRLSTYLWYAERQHGGSAHLAIPSPTDWDASLGLTEGDLVAQLVPSLRTLTASLGNEERRASWHEAISHGRLAALAAAGMLNKSFGISGQFIRGKKREELQTLITDVERQIRSLVNSVRAANLSRQGQAQYALHSQKQKLRAGLMERRGVADFDELTKGAYRLFSGDAGLGVRYLLARTTRHLLLDEFQDTSRLQWAIFAEMTTSLLAGDESLTDDEGPPASVFIVGDAKQSIYGFREADPTVMGDAAVLIERLQNLPLNDSYRTAQVVLDFVNQVFADGALKDFPPHATARVDGRPVVPDLGRVTVLPLALPTEVWTAAEQEAETLAETLLDALTGKTPHPVVDKATGETRPLRAGDCALLYRAGTHAEVYEAALRKRGIPCQREEARGFFARSEIQDATALLRFLALPADTLSLATVLRSPFGGVRDEAVLELCQATLPLVGDGHRAKRILELLATDHPTLAEILARLERRAGLDLPHALLAQGLADLDAFGAYSRADLYVDLTPEVARKTAAPMARANLIRLLELILTLEDEGHTTLPAVVKRLEQLADGDEVGTAGLAMDAVTLMTIHKAKGLEFPLVAVVDTGRSWGKQDPYWVQTTDEEGRPCVSYIGKADDQPLGDSAFDRLTKSSARAITEECYRLLYVALTRARQYLLVTGHQPTRRTGLPGSILYDVMAKAALSLPAGRTTWEAGDLTESSRQRGEPSAPKSSDVPPRLLVAATPDEPREIRIVSPSQDHDRSPGGPQVLQTVPWGDAKTATAVGRFLHAGMECFLADRPFEATIAWKSIAAGLVIDSALVNDAENLLREAQSDPIWADLKSQAVRIETELDLVHQADASTLVRGSLDLLAVFPDGRARIIDYKTTRFEATPTDEQLRTFSVGRGYVTQLQAYREAVQAMMPKATVEIGVYFMSLRRMCFLLPS